MRPTLTKYISLEIWSILFTCLIVFLLIMISFELIGSTDFIVTYGVGFSGILKLILCNIPKMLMTAMPAACLTATLLAFLRMSSDNEIISLYSSGISLNQLMAPVLIFSALCCLLGCLTAVYLVPYGNKTEEQLFISMRKEAKSFSPKERIFNTQIKGIVFYFNSYSQKSKTMEDIFLVDEREMPVNTIMAKKARIIPKQDTGIVSIRFFDNVCWYRTFKNGMTTTSREDELTYSINIDQMVNSRAVINEPEDMFIEELFSIIKSPEEKAAVKQQAKLILYEMISLPVSIFLLGMIGAPLGAHVKSRGRSAGIVISLAVFLSYNISLLFSRYLIEMNRMPPFLGVCVPVFFLILFCAFLLMKENNSDLHEVFKGYFIKLKLIKPNIYNN